MSRPRDGGDPFSALIYMNSRLRGIEGGLPMTSELRERTIAALKDDPGLGALARSLDVYYGDTGREAAMDRLYGRFIRPDDLAFDIGSHVGDRIASFRRLGARVVALEPQPDCARVIRALYEPDRHVELIEAACGAQAGSLTLQVNSANPTVSTASPAFVRAAAGAPGWEGQRWDRQLEVGATTLDALISAHGLPAFVKIDVEGCEHEVLLGLSQGLPALSFEFTTIQRDVAAHCLSRLAALGDYRFNVSLGENHALTFADWLTAEDMNRHLVALPDAANSGDVYAVASGQSLRRPGFHLHSFAASGSERYAVPDAQAGEWI